MNFTTKHLKLRSLCHLLALILAVAALPLAGCGDKDASGSDDGDEREESKKPGKDDEDDEDFTLPGTYLLTGVYKDGMLFDRDMFAVAELTDVFRENPGAGEKALQDFDSRISVLFNKYELILNEDHTGQVDGDDCVWREDDGAVTLYENEDAMEQDEDPVRAVIDGSSLRLYADPDDSNYYEIFRHKEKVTPYENYGGDYTGTYKTAYLAGDSFEDRSDIEKLIYRGGQTIEASIESANILFEEIVLHYRENGECTITFPNNEGKLMEYTLEGEPGGRIFTVEDPDGGDPYPVVFFREYALAFVGGELGVLVMTTKKIPEPEKWILREGDPEFDSHPAAKALESYSSKLADGDYDGLAESIPDAVVKFAAKTNGNGVAEEYLHIAGLYKEAFESVPLPRLTVETIIVLSDDEVQKYFDDDFDELWADCPYEECWELRVLGNFDGEERETDVFVIKLDGGFWVVDGVF